VVPVSFDVYFSSGLEDQDSYILILATKGRHYLLFLDFDYNYVFLVDFKEFLSPIALRDNITNKPTITPN